MPETQDEDMSERALTAKIHKAIAIIQMKLEGQLAFRRPEFGMEKRALLDKIDRRAGTVKIGDKVYALADMNFPTVDPNAPYELTDGEKRVCEKLQAAFLGSEKLGKHIEFLFSYGGMYRVYNGNLLYHGCVPLKEDGSFLAAKIGGKEYAGKALFDVLEEWIRRGRYATNEEERAFGQDVMWFVWANEKSPLYGKDKMATFEKYFIDDKDSAVEVKNAYYRLLDKEKVVKKIFDEFGVDFESGHIVNGHVPVKVKKGESPVHCGGKVIIIDGGFSRAYQKVTGIAGYTLVSDSRTVKLIAHQPFVSAEEAVRSEQEMHSTAEIIRFSEHRLRIGDTDAGKELRERIVDLNALIAEYKSGRLKERNW
jgi:fructose-1,6-bisphosphatase-3